MKKHNFNTGLILILLLLAVKTSFGQTAKTVIKQPPSAILIEKIKVSEEKFQRLSERATKYKDLFAREMVSRREWETAQTDVEREGLNLAEIRSESANAEELASLSVEFSSENEYESVKELLKDSAADVAKIRKNLSELRAAQFSDASSALTNSIGYVRRTNALVRFAGDGSWNLKDAGQIQSFFQSRFSRSLPVSAFGQTNLHTRWGFDHRSAMDVALHPDSVEGRALIAYLESRNIPFIAIRQAIPGSATAPHIHIGMPSHRIR